MIVSKGFLMKRLLFFVMAIALHSADIEWFYDYKEALDTAKKEHKNILVFMSQPGCGSCEYMKENVFVDAGVEAYMNAHYIALNFSIYDEEVPEHLKVRVTPVFHFLNGEGEPIHAKLIGGKTPPFFLKALQEAGKK